MISAIVISLSPFITSAITGFLKNLTPFSSLADQSRTPIVRVLAAFIALVYTVLGMYVTGNISPDILTTTLTAFVFSLLAWLGSLGIFHAFFQKK